MQETREIVVPGDLLDDSGRMKPGFNTYREGERIYATRLGVKSVRGDRVSVISLSGRYEPMRGDMVIGTAVESGPSNWYIQIGAAHDVGLHVNDVPWRVEFGETSKYIAIGDTVVLRISHVDEMRKVQASMKDRQCRKLTGGVTLKVAPSKVPRVIGRNGSMIQTIKDMTDVRVFVGQNGVVWIDGEPADVALATEAIQMVEREAHTSGLTDRVTKFLEERRGVSYAEVRKRRSPDAMDDEPAYGRRMDEGEGGEDRPGGGESREGGFRERRERDAGDEAPRGPREPRERRPKPMDADAEGAKPEGDEDEDAVDAKPKKPADADEEEW